MGKIVIRDLRDKFFQMDDEYLNGYARLCGVYSTVVYNSLCRHVNKNQKCFPSIKLIAEEHKIGMRTVIRAIKKLEDYNIIKREKTRSKKGKWLNNLYVLLDKSSWKKKPSATQAQGVQVPENTKPSARDDINQVPHRHTKETHREVNTYKDGEIKNFTPPIYEELDNSEQTYDTKKKTYAKKGIDYKPSKVSKATDRSFTVLRLIDFFKEQAYDLQSLEYFSHPKDKNSRMIGQASTFFTRCDNNERKAKEIIEWFLDEYGDWCQYSPKQCFTPETVQRFQNKDKSKIKVYKI